jgi:hypothetical protein
MNLNSKEGQAPAMGRKKKKESRKEDRCLKMLQEIKQEDHLSKMLSLRSRKGQVLETNGRNLKRGAHLVMRKFQSAGMKNQSFRQKKDQLLLSQKMSRKTLKMWNLK